MVEFLAFRYNKRNSRLGQLVNSCPSYTRKVHAFLTQTKLADIPCPVPEAPRPVRPVDLFDSLLDSVTPVLSVEMLRHRLVGHHLMSWEADLVFPLWLAVWREWHSQWGELNVSTLPVLDLESRRRQISTAPVLYKSPTMVGNTPDASAAWHEDFFSRLQTVGGCSYDGNCVLVCGSSFDWADVFMPAVSFSVQEVCGGSGSCVRRSGDVMGSLHLVAGHSVKLVVSVLVAGLQDPLATVVLVSAPDCWSLLWATVDAEVASTGWLAIAEWQSSRDSNMVLPLLVRAPVPPLPPLVILVDGTAWTIRAGLSIPPVCCPSTSLIKFSALLMETPPRGASLSGSSLFLG